MERYTLLLLLDDARNQDDNEETYTQYLDALRHKLGPLCNGHHHRAVCKAVTTGASNTTKVKL
jgi:hypothetical protein